MDHRIPRKPLNISYVEQSQSQLHDFEVLLSSIAKTVNFVARLYESLSDFYRRHYCGHSSVSRQQNARVVNESL